MCDPSLTITFDRCRSHSRFQFRSQVTSESAVSSLSKQRVHYTYIASSYGVVGYCSTRLFRCARVHGTYRYTARKTYDSSLDVQNGQGKSTTKNMYYYSTQNVPVYIGTIIIGCVLKKGSRSRLSTAPKISVLATIVAIVLLQYIA